VVPELQFLIKINSGLIENAVRAAESSSMTLKAVTLRVIVNGLLWTSSSLAGNPGNADAVRPGPATTNRVGQLIVYTATHEFEDGHDTWAYPHTSYFIYRPDGSRYKYVSNHISRGDSQPDTVDLPSGQYYIVGQADFAPRTGEDNAGPYNHCQSRARYRLVKYGQEPTNTRLSMRPAA
jgi:hypothetical protein